MLFLPVFIYPPLNGEIERSSGCLAQNYVNFPLTHTPFSPTPPHLMSPLEITVPLERTEGGSDSSPTMTWVCQGKCPAQQLHSSLPPCRACSTELAGSPFITLKDTSLLQTLYISSFTYENLADQTFMPLASLSSPFPLLFALRAN